MYQVEFKPETTELSVAEQNMIGEFFETPTYRVLQKMFQIERWEQVNLSLIHTKDVLDIGEVRGAINVLNKFEAMISSYNADMQERAKKNPDEEDEEEDELSFASQS